MQLIYRWTKSLDPSLRRGYWAPEEDAVGVWALGCGRRARCPHRKRTESGVGGSVTVCVSLPAEVASSRCQIRGAGLV